MGSYRVCVCFHRKFKAEEALPPEEVRQLFTKYAAGGAHMTADHLLRFLVDFQGEAADVDARLILEDVLQKRHHITKFVRHSLTLDDFLFFLFSTDLNPPIRSQVLRSFTIFFFLCA